MTRMCEYHCTPGLPQSRTVERQKTPTFVICHGCPHMGLKNTCSNNKEMLCNRRHKQIEEGIPFHRPPEGKRKGSSMERYFARGCAMRLTLSNTEKTSAKLGQCWLLCMIRTYCSLKGALRKNIIVTQPPWCWAKFKPHTPQNSISGLIWMSRHTGCIQFLHFFFWMCAFSAQRHTWAHSHQP